MAAARPEPRPFSAYLHLWSMCNLLRISVAFNAGTGLVGSTLDRGAVALPALILLAGIFPARLCGALPFAALLARALTNLTKGSMMSNSQLWATQMDTAVLIALGSCMLRRWPLRAKAPILGALSAEEEATIIGGCARTIRWQLSIFYFASGFWKVNTSFMNVSYSCASLFTVQPLEYLPDALLYASGEGLAAQAVPLLARFIAAIGPAATLVIESVVPALHLLEPSRYPVCAVIGVASTVAFHLVIGLTPPPSNVSSFGVTTCTRLFFMLPAATTATVEELKLGLRGGSMLLGAVMVVAAAASLAIVAPFHRAAVSTVQGEGQDWHLAYYACLCVLFARACFLELAPPSPAAAPASSGVAAPQGKKKTPIQPSALAMEEGRPYRKLVALSLVYAFALPVAGLQEKAGCLMFSQLRLHGGSNHYLLPTSLLQRALVDAEPSNAFSGGVVRVESTSLEWVGNTFAEHMGERTLHLIRNVTGVPAEYVWAAKATSLKRAVPPPRFRRHTLSNYGLRKLLATARRQKDDFFLRYTRLEGAVGDEVWRTTSSGVEYVVRGDGSGSVRCAKVGALGLELACDDREVGLIGDAEIYSRALAFFLEPQPNPLIEGYTEEMHCVTWG